jgi:hypothetical protein
MSVPVGLLGRRAPQQCLVGRARRDDLFQQRHVDIQQRDQQPAVDADGDQQPAGSSVAIITSLNRGVCHR